MLKSNPTTNRYIRTSVTMPGFKAPSTNNNFAVLFRITDVNRPGHNEYQQNKIFAANGHETDFNKRVIMNRY